MAAALNSFDILLIAPGLLTLIAFALLGCAKGNASVGYTLFGSRQAGNALFLYMVSLMVLGPLYLIAFAWGLWRIIARLV